MADEKQVEWNSNLSFILAMIGSAVGLGNIWRYPYVAYSNGGGAFMLPYIISIIFMGIPLLFLEYGTGYKFKAGISKIFHKINKKYEYFGWFMEVTPFVILTYYVCVVAWDLLYVPVSFYKGWGTDPENFFNTVLLQSSSDISGLFHISIYVLMAIIVLWLVLWYISHKNLNDGVGKVNRILTPLLFLMMIVIVFFALTLPGASLGLTTLFTPDWNSILNPSIWLAAFGQILFSLSIGLTITIAYTSYLPNTTDIPRNALRVAIANSGFEVFTATGVFSILGYMSSSSGIPIGELVSQGTQLAFVAFPQVFNIMGIYGYIIGPLFFLCLLFAGITSNVSIIEPLALSLQDKFGMDRSRAVTMVCVAAGAISLVFATNYGPTLLGIFDTFANQFGLLLNVLIQIIVIAIIYGLDKLLPGINQNASFLKLGRSWKILVSFIIPLIAFILWIDGIIHNIIFVDKVTFIIQGLLLLFMIILPIFLTKYPQRRDDF